MLALKSLWSKLLARMKIVVAHVFGRVAWQPPTWCLTTKNWVAAKASAGKTIVRANPRESIGVIVSLWLLAGAGWLAWRWYESQPRPVEFEFTVHAPAITCYSCEPQGKPNPVIVSFSGSTAPLDLVGHGLDPAKSGIALSPKIEGQWSWDDDSTLRFQPAVDWPIDVTYSVKLTRAKFVPAHVRLNRYEFEFKTAPFAARLANTEFYQDPIVARNKKVVATLNFSHPVDPESLERRIELKMFDKVNDRIEKELARPTYTVVFDKLKLNAYIHSGDIEIPAKAGRLAINIERGLRAARGGNKTEVSFDTSVAVPGLNSLAVQQVALDIARDERNEPDQILFVNLSASVKERELTGKLTAWMLPLKHPDPKVQANFERFANNKPFNWSIATVKPEIIALSTRLELKPIPSEREHYELHSFKYKADPGRQVFVTVQRGLQSFGGYLLDENREQILSVPEFPREIGILHEGSLLAMSGDKTLTVLSRNIGAIRVEVGRLLPKQLQHLVTQSGGSFGRPTFNNWAFDAANITETFSKTLTLPSADPGSAHYEAIDLGQFLSKDPNDRRGIFLLRVQAWDLEHDRPLSGYSPDRWSGHGGDALSDARLVVLTDLGLLVKRSLDGTQDVFVQSLHSGRPVAGATVSVIGLNGLAVLHETTDAEGHVRFGDLKDYQREKRPVLYLATQNGDSSFLPFDDRARTLDLSRFDVGGIDNRVDRQALSAYLFSDRGIYRPGEQIKLAALIRSQDWQQRLSGVPLRLEVTDPRGTVVRRESFTPGAASFGEIIHDTKESSPTGTYTFALSIVRTERSSDLIGSTTVQVRDFLPDRLRMHIAFSSDSLDGWVSPTDLKAKINLKNLFGTAAEKRRITSQVTLSPSFPTFRGYPDYLFFDPELARESFSERIPDSETDENGNTTLVLNLQRFARATYRVHVTAEGFEADGGRGVSADAAQLVSNMPYLVGYKPDGSLSYLSRNSERSIDLIAIDPTAKRTALEKLTLTRLEIRYVSVLMKQPNGTYKYESRRKESELGDTPLIIAANGSKIRLDTSSPGSFAYKVRNAEGVQLSRVDYQVAGDANLTRKMDKNAELEMSLAKKDVSPGEELEVSVRAPYAGAGLITIERERVFAWRWFKASTTASIQKIKVPDTVEGNAYVTVTFVRDPSSPEIYSSPLSHGVLPFSIDLDARRNAITLDAPTKVKPGETVALKYRTEKPSRIVLFAVDEGILQVARYENPKPLEFFFQKRALAVGTVQILDLLLPEFRRLELSAAPGGDGESLLSQHLNPFKRKGEKPMTFWSGILDADAVTREVKFVVPDYFNGSLRVLAVAAADDRIGVHTGSVVVRGDFVLSPNAPTTVSPGDEFDVSVGVSNNVVDSGKDAPIDVALEAGAGLEIIDGARRSTKIGEGREDSVRFRLRARDQLGSQSMNFTATTQAGAGGSAKRKIDLSLRPATPYMTQLTAGVVRNGSRDVPLPRDLYPHYRKLEAGVSILPLSFAHGFTSYLSNYPYACTEQIVSQAIPAMVLSDRPEFGYVRSQAGASIVGLMSELRWRQNDEGAYKLWPGSDLVVEFVSLYAQHALIEAGERNERVPGDLVLRGNTYLRKIAARDGNTLGDERNSALAIYLLTRQAQNAASELSALRKRLDERYKKEWSTDLTALWLAATYDLLKKDDEAARLLRGVRFSASATYGSYDVYFDPMTHDALLLWITAKHFPEKLSGLPPEVLTNLAKRVSEGRYVSLSAGTTLLALDAYATAGATQLQKLSIAEVERSDKRIKPIELPEALFPKVAFSEQAAALRIGNESQLNAYYLIDQSGFDRKPPTTAIRQGMEVLREYSDTDGKALSKVVMGQEILVRLRFRSLDGRHARSVALVDLLPGGFELVVPPQGAINPHSSATLTDVREQQAGETNTDSSSAYSSWRCQLCVTSPSTLEYADMREDRAVFYVSTMAQAQEVVYRIKATNVGKFIAPPAYGEAMYDRSIMARSIAGALEVVRP